MEQYYYNHMDKQKQAAYHAMLQGIRNLVDEFPCTMFFSS